MLKLIVVQLILVAHFVNCIEVSGVKVGEKIDNLKRCSKGANYWCESIEKAKECGAFKHCLQTVWTKHKSYFQISKQVESINPTKCSVCVDCIYSDLRRCPTIRFFKDEITELMTYNLPNESICKLMSQCNELDFVESSLNDSERDESQQHKQEERQNVINVNEGDKRFSCGIHPRHWCNNLETSRRCNSFDDCLIGWSKSNIKYKLKETKINDENIEQDEQQNNERNKLNGNLMSHKTCGYCIFVFNKLQSFIQENTTEAEVEQYLKGACSLLPNKEEVEECLNDVQKYFSEIYNIVRNNVDPGIICRVLKVCSDSFLEPQLGESQQQQPKPQQDSSNKESASFKIGNIKIRVLNEDDVIIKTPLQNSNIQQIEIQKQRELNFAAKTEILAKKLSATNGVGCELCSIVLTGAKYLLENKLNEEKVLDFIEKELCARLGSFNDTCVNYVSEDGAFFLEILSKTDPNVLCRGMAMCLSVQLGTGFATQSENQKFFDLNVRNDLNCTLCKFTVDEVKTKLANNKTQAEIFEYIDRTLCDKIGSSSQLCKSLISTYGALLLEIILREVQPNQFCEMIGMCSQQQQQQQLEQQQGQMFIEMMRKNLKEKAAKIQTSSNCALCEFAISLLKKYLNENSTEAQIEQSLEYVCDHAIPTSLRNECNNFVETYGPIIASLIASNVDPEKVCELIGLCPSSFASQPHLNNKMPLRNEADQTLNTQNSIKTQSLIDLVPANKRSQNSDSQKTSNEQQNGGEKLSDKTDDKNNTLECSLCIYVAETVDKSLKDNKTESEIVAELELVCNLFPTSLKDQCDAFIDEYGPYVVQLIAADLDPQTACAELKLCDNSIKKINKRRLSVNSIRYKIKP